MPFVIHDGVRIYYETAGSGAPLVLLHGLSDSIAAWREYGYVDQLKDHMQLIQIDGRGHGFSDKPHSSSAYDLKLRVGDVVAVLDALKLARASYVGYSMGAVIGFGLAVHAPERVDRLVLGGAHPYGGSTAFFRQIFDQGLLAWVELLEQLAGPLPFITRERLLGNDLDALRASVAEDRPNLAPELAASPLPIELYVGADDPACALVERYAGEQPGIVCSVLPGLNHFQAAARSDLVAPLILGSFKPQAQPLTPVS